MPGVDDLSQNVPYPLLSDPPNIEHAMSTMVDAVVPKLNMTFADANARSATIPSPTAGMECFLIAEKRKEIYDGTAWIPLTASGWIPLTFNTGYEPFEGSPAYRIVNQTVELRGSVKRTGFVPFPNATEIYLATMPTIARPPFERTFCIASEWSSDLYAWVRVHATGVIMAGVPPTNGVPSAQAPRVLYLDPIRYSLT
ncbi:hypothetical protein [Streptomyces xanthophaeus]